ncbi:MAG TPA: hypothetical protein VLJ10_05810, partial [Candidatus Bathyarchaeia archaeon]|nr:hypothetical protein [Candidatus Bathyarchaeia archaeon]
MLYLNMAQSLLKQILLNLIHYILLFIFTLTEVLPVSLGVAYAQTGAPLAISGLNLPAPGTMVQVSPDFIPPHLIGLKLYPDNPLRFDFVLDKGDDAVSQEDLQKESLKLINYFLAALTVPQNELWVNLSPYEENRIIPASFSVTEMGRDLLGQDYLLKQLTASLIHPDSETGKIFWKRINEMTGQVFADQEAAVDTFHKIWIVPDQAVVYVKDDMAFIMESHLKVMLEQDYLALQNNAELRETHNASLDKAQSEIMREVVLPVIEQEVNDGENFALLRQVYHSMILATWFKRNFKQSALGKVYADQNKVHGIDLEDKAAKEKIYKQYVETFEKGVFDFIREDVDEASGVAIPRRYFSGGFMGGKELDEAVTETRQPSRGFVESILKRMKGILLIGAALTALSTADAITPAASAAPTNRSPTAAAASFESQQRTYAEARRLLIDHMNFVVKNDGVGIANHRNFDRWKSFIRDLIFNYEDYPRAATAMITNEDLL